MYSRTTATNRVAALTKRIRAIQGGTSASKTVSILLYLIARAQSDTTPTITSIVSESFPHLRRGAMRDFLNILEEHRYYKDDRWSKTDFTYTFETGSKIEFFSADQPGKVRGPRRDRLFINEANNVPYEAFDQLEVRTKEFIFLDWNPTTSFWYYDYGDPNRPGIGVKDRDDVDHIILTYRDNEALDPAIVASIEQHKGHAAWWKVYGEGQLGEVEGRIYRGWQAIDEIPHEARLERYGLDFGYSNDPTALIAVYYLNGGYILDEIAYLKGLSNKQIADLILNQPRKALVVADSAEPKSIDEIRLYGVNITATTKGPGSLLQRIQMMQDQQISYTKRSTNLAHEYNKYMWDTDTSGRIINEPVPLWDHAMDAAGYAIRSLVPVIQRADMIANMPRYAPSERKNPAF